MLKRILVGVLSLLLAIVCMSIGAVKGAVAFIIIGVIFEGVFWYLVTKKDKKLS